MNCNHKFTDILLIFVKEKTRSSVCTLWRVQLKCYFCWALTTLFIKWWHPANGIHEYQIRLVRCFFLKFHSHFNWITTYQNCTAKLDQLWRAIRTENNSSNNFGIHEFVHQQQINEEERREINEMKRSFMWHTVSHTWWLFCRTHNNLIWKWQEMCCFYFFLVFWSRFSVFWSYWNCLCTHFHCIACTTARVCLCKCKSDRLACGSRLIMKFQILQMAC